MPRIEKKVSKEEFDKFINTFPHPTHVQDLSKVPPTFTTTYIKGTVQNAGYAHEDVIAIVRNYSKDRLNPNSEDAYYIYEEVGDALNPGL